MKGSDLFLKPDKTNNSHRGIIVGFDPGLTVGIAILDLNGNLISLTSCKEIKRSEIISHIITYGKTVLVATDVYPVPKTVKKLATTLNSKIWSPYKCMSVESKIDIVDSYIQYENNKSLEIPQNAHERDALAAAVKTYRDHLNKFRQITKRAEKAELNDSTIDTIKTLVINGVSISNAIKQISEDKNRKNTILKDSNKNLSTIEVSKPELEATEIVVDDTELDLECSKDTNDIVGKPNNDNVAISRLKHKLKSQKRYIDNLKRKNILLEENNHYYKTEISKLQSKVDKLHYSYTKKILQKKEVSSKVAIIKRLQDKYNDEKSRRIKLEDELRSLKEIKPSKNSENNLPLKIIEFFTKEGIREACDKWDIGRDDIVLLINSEGGGSQTASMIIKLGVKSVITMDKISDPAENIFEENMVPLIPANNVKMYSTGEFYFVNSKDFDFEMEKWNKHVNNQKRRENNKNLLKLVDEYRAQRRRP